MHMDFIRNNQFDLDSFLVCMGAFSGSPELTALYQAQQMNSKVESIDIISATKMMQNTQFAQMVITK